MNGKNKLTRFGEKADYLMSGGCRLQMGIRLIPTESKTTHANNMSSPKKKVTAKATAKFKDLKPRKNPKGGDESPKEEIFFTKLK